MDSGDKEMTKEIIRATEIIKRGGVVIYPTDTAYALGVDASNVDALEKLYRLKNMPRSKPTHVSVLNIDGADKYAIVDERARALAKSFLPGPLSIVLPSRKVLPEMLTNFGKEGQCIRIPDHPVALKLLEIAGVPITATSANYHTKPATYSLGEIEESFGKSLNQIDFILDAGQLAHRRPSTIVSLIEDEPLIIREGPITLDDILLSLRKL